MCLSLMKGKKGTAGSVSGMIKDLKCGRSDLLTVTFVTNGKTGSDGFYLIISPFRSFK